MTNQANKLMPKCVDGLYFWYHSGFQAQVHHTYATFEEMFKFTVVPAMRQLLIDWGRANGHLSQTGSKGAR